MENNFGLDQDLINAVRTVVENKERLDEAYDGKSSAHKIAKRTARGMSGLARAEYHSDGSASVHTKGRDNISSTRVVDHHHDIHGLGYNRSKEDYNSSSFKDTNGLTHTTKETGPNSHSIHIKEEIHENGLHPNQKILDKNKNGKLDSDDFKKLRKEEEDYSLEELQNFMMSEEFEHLDELSKNTLGSYIKAASSDKESRVKHDGELRKTDDSLRDAEWLVRSHHINDKEVRDQASTGVRAARAVINKHLDANDNKKYKRGLGIRTALKKLTKEQMEDYSLEELEDFMMSEDFEQLDEVSGELLGRYIQKARADVKTRYQQGRDLDAHPKVAPLKAKLKDYYNSRSHTNHVWGISKSRDSAHSKAIDKTHDKIEAIKKKIDPEYPKSANPQRRGNMVDKALDKLRSGKLTNEQVAEIEMLAAKHGLEE